MFTKDKIKKTLTDHFQPQYILVEDDSARHAGHAQALQTGGKHFSVVIVSNKFAGKTLMERHRIVYEILKDGMKKEIHALAIKALTPLEYKVQ